MFTNTDRRFVRAALSIAKYVTAVSTNLPILIKHVNGFCLVKQVLWGFRLNNFVISDLVNLIAFALNDNLKKKVLLFFCSEGCLYFGALSLQKNGLIQLFLLPFLIIALTLPYLFVLDLF